MNLSTLSFLIIFWGGLSCTQKNIQHRLDLQFPDSSTFVGQEKTIAVLDSESDQTVSRVQNQINPVPNFLSSGDSGIITLLAVGDIMLGSHYISKMDSFGLQFPFQYLTPLLVSADLIIGNLEAPIADSGVPSIPKQFIFNIPPRLASTLSQHNINAVCLANNHIMDRGSAGLGSTLQVLDSLKIGHFGAGSNLTEARQIYYKTIKGTSFAMLGYSCTFPPEFWATDSSPGTAFGDSQFIREDVKTARQHAEVVIVSFHWGAEKMDQPKLYQQELAHFSIDCGADVVIGHHPHVLQGIEIYNGKMIFYSLGNFVFASYSNHVFDSMILRMRFQGVKLQESSVLPILINNFQVELQPRPLEGEEARQSLERFAQLCNKLKTTLTIDQAVGYIRF